MNTPDGEDICFSTVCSLWTWPYESDWFYWMVMVTTKMWWNFII